MSAKSHFQKYFSCIMAVSFIRGENQGIGRNHWKGLSPKVVWSTPCHNIMDASSVSFLWHNFFLVWEISFKYRNMLDIKLLLFVKYKMFINYKAKLYFYRENSWIQLITQILSRNGELGLEWINHSMLLFQQLYWYYSIHKSLSLIKYMKQVIVIHYILVYYWY
jgi:hypothetical protein